MKNEHALRFLLLRQFNIIKSQLPAHDFERGANSLHVEMIKDDYKVSWDSGAGIQEKIYAKDTFVFYQRGDINPEERTIADSVVNRNDEEARRLTQEIFNRPLDFNLPPKYPVDPLDIFDMAGDALFLMVLLSIGEFNLIGIAVLMPLLYVEYLQRLRAIVPLYLIALVFSGWGAGVMLSAPVYACLQFLDPSPHLRALRVAGGLIAFAVCLIVYVMFHQLPFYLGLSFWIVVILAGVIVGLRILFCCNHSSVRLMLPFFLAGLYAAGFAKSALAGFAYAGINLFIHAYGFKYLPFLKRLRNA